MRARLTIVRGEGSPRAWELEPGAPITIGRSHHNHVVLQDDRDSRQHAKIYFESGKWFLNDNGTLNGTRVNAIKVERPVMLRDGHDIDIADTRLHFAVLDDA